MQLKVLELDIDSDTYDFPGADSKIGRYCVENDIPANVKPHMRLLFEELVHQILMPELSEPHIRFTFELSEKENTIGITVLYNGEPFDPANMEDQLSFKILQSLARDWTYSEVSDKEDFTNCITAVINM